ncbi:major facilitator superfamily domain-containing protein [Chlamydoabsidia padenii]|nr:major facilitator superfamily domain-containing protein [Chlamydoabsidia padenii]
MYLLCKLLYISVFALLSAAPPYLPLYYHDALGFSSDQIGFVLAIAPFIQTAACPLWTIVVDKRPKIHGAVMGLTALIGGTAVTGIMMLGHAIASQSYQLSGSTLVMLTSTFALTYAFFSLPNVSLVDSAVMKILGPNKILYGQQRLWGSVSCGLTILLVGQLISMTNNLDAMFYVSGISSLAFAFFSFLVRFDEEQDDKMEHERLLSNHYNNQLQQGTSGKEKRYGGNYQSMMTTDEESYSNLCKATTTHSMASVREEAEEALETVGVDLGLAISRIPSVDQSMAHILEDDVPSLSVFRSVRVITFLITTLMLGISLSMIVYFLFLFQGQRFGVTKLVLAAHFATAIRCIGYTLLVPDKFITNILAMLLQTLHGIGFGIFWATAVSEIDGFFPPEQRSVAQGILGALHAGLGTGLGALIGGYVYEYYGAISLFRLSAFLCVVSSAIFCIGRLPRYNVN